MPQLSPKNPSRFASHKTAVMPGLRLAGLTAAMFAGLGLLGSASALAGGETSTRVTGDGGPAAQFEFAPKSSKSIPAEKLPEQLKVLLAEPGIRYLESFKKADGIIGYVYQVRDEIHVFYGIKGTDLVAAGNLIDKDGNVVSDDDAKRYGNRIDKGLVWNSTGAVQDAYQSQAAAALAKITTMKLSSGDAKAYVFFDGYCGYCKRQWEEIKKAGLDNIEVIPVAKIRQNSDKIAAELIESADPSAALEATHYPEKLEAISAKRMKLSPETAAKLQVNNEFMDQLRLNGTPAWVWVTADGKVRTKSGMLDAAALLSMKEAAVAKQ